MHVTSVLRRSLLLIPALVVLAPQATAFEFFGGRLEAHGFFESQLRVLNEDFSEDWDVAQWYQVLDVEFDLNIIDDTWLGIDHLSAFVRLEVRYDCVYTHGCGMFRSINAYGNKAQSLPRRLSSGDKVDTAGVLLIERGGRLSGDTTDPVLFSGLSDFRLIAETEGQTIYRETLGYEQLEDEKLAPDPGTGCETESAQYFNCFPGPTSWSLNFEDFKDHRFTQIHTRTGAIAPLGPWLPKNNIDLNATMSGTPNPFDTVARSRFLFAGYFNHDGFPVDNYRNEWGASDPPYPTGIKASDIDAEFQTDPVVAFTVKMIFPEAANDAIALRLPLLESNIDPNLADGNIDADKIGYNLDAFGVGVSTDFVRGGSVRQQVTLNYPRLGAGGSGARPYRPTSIVDHDTAFHLGPDVEEIEFNVGCKQLFDGGGSVTGTRCLVRELGATIEYDLNDEIVDTSDYNLKFGEYYHGLQDARRTVCQTGDIRCFERAFEREMGREGYNVECGTNAGCLASAGVSESLLDSVIQQAFERIQALECLESQWDCSDRLLEVVEDSITALKASGHEITCAGGTLGCEEEIARYLIRFGTRYVISATRSDAVARGNFIPSRPLGEFLDSGRRTFFPFNLSESERTWNRGYAQNDEKELKEAYFDIELMDSRLWLRIGKQTIVWGKTELFRTTDQFNPQDFSLASLGSLEETRISLWAFRGVYSLYEVGPLSDVRVEFAFNFDDFSASDLGACGEAFAINEVCRLTFGALVHGITGTGLAGVLLPPYRWYDPRGWEIGGRVEWRWDRFSFALTNFWGYNDLPTNEFISHFSRNVDPFSGRPRRMGFTGPCGTTEQDIITTRSAAGLSPLTSDVQGYIDAISASGSGGLGNPTILAQYQAGNVPESCLRPGPTHREAYLANLPANPDLSDLTATALGIRELREIPGVSNPIAQRLPVNNSYRAFIAGNALDEHPANLNLFTWMCSSTVGFSSLDPKACAQTVFGSTRDFEGIGPISLLIGGLMGGGPDENNFLTLPRGNKPEFLPVSAPFVTLPFLDTRNDPLLDNIDLTDPALIARREIESYGCFDPQHATSNFNPLDVRNAQGSLFAVGCGLSRGKLSTSLTPEQEALLGCGPFFGTNCDNSGFDLLNAKASAILQSFVGIEGTIQSLKIFEDQLRAAGRGDVEAYFRTDGWVPFLGRETGSNGALLKASVNSMLQPGTVRWRQAGIDTPVCTTNHLGGRTRTNASGIAITAPRRLPGCRGLVDYARGDGSRSAAEIVDEFLSGTQVSVYAGGGNFSPRGDDKGFFINEDFFLFHAYVPDVLDENGVVDPAAVKYPGIKCSPDPGSICRDRLLGFVDESKYHNQWDEGFDINVDGSPFQLQLKHRTASGLQLKLPGHSITQANVSPVIAPKNLPTPNCPDCATLLTGFASGTNDQLGNGQPFTGDIFTSEMAGFSYNFMMLLVTFDEDFQKIMQTITSGPTGPSSVIPSGIGDTFILPYFVNGPGALQTQGNCHEAIRELPDSGVGRSNNIRICGVERRRFAVHYAYSGNEWGTRNPEDEFPDSWMGLLALKQNRPEVLLTYDYVENRFIGMEIVNAGSDEGSGEFIEAGAHCSFITPQNCKIIQSLFALAGVQHRAVKAGGSGNFGRRTFIWHSGGEIIAKFDRRNVLGFAVDFAEDVTKSNWGIEFTWVEGLRVSDYDKWEGLSKVNDFDLTISIDRPTFIHFLNPNHTFFLNTQWFIKFRDGYRKSMPANGPVNVLGLVFIQTGYFQDRLLPALTGVYDFMSGSGAALPQLTFRYTENFSIVVGANMFMGKEQIHEMPLAGIGPVSNQRGEYAYKVGVENGIAALRDRDEVFMKLRYTF
jgi:hypothetical protein